MGSIPVLSRASLPFPIKTYLCPTQSPKIFVNTLIKNLLWKYSMPQIQLATAQRSLPSEYTFGLGLLKSLASYSWKSTSPVKLYTPPDPSPTVTNPKG